MRLIDADAFKEYMRKALEETRDCYPDKGEWAEAITEQFCKDIDDQPTIEPERKKGKWIYIRTDADGNAWYECSECHMGEVHVPIVEVKYCWHCGAKMDGSE